jgi:hypothetical protein
LKLQLNQIFSPEVINIFENIKGNESLTLYLKNMKLINDSFNNSKNLKLSTNELEDAYNFFNDWNNWLNENGIKNNVSKNFIDGLKNNLKLISEEDLNINLKYVGNNPIEGYFGLVRTQYKRSFTVFEILIDKSKRDNEYIKKNNENRGFSWKGNNNNFHYKEIVPEIKKDIQLNLINNNEEKVNLNTHLKKKT